MKYGASSSLSRDPGEESPKCSPESRRQKLPRGERQTSQSVCLFTENGSRSILPPRTVIWEPGSHKHMLNDSIYSPRHYLFIFASLFSLMVLPICTSSFLSPTVYSSYGCEVSVLPSVCKVWRSSEFEKCAATCPTTNSGQGFLVVPRAAVTKGSVVF